MNTVGIALGVERASILGGLAQTVVFRKAVETHLVVAVGITGVTHLDREHDLLVLVRLPLQAVFAGVRIVGSRPLVGVGPEVALVADQAETAVLDAILEPGDHLVLGDGAALGEGQVGLLVEAGVEQPHAGHQALGGPPGHAAFAEVGILRGRTVGDGGLQVGSDLGVDLVRRGLGKVHGVRGQHQGDAAEDLGQVEIVERTKEISLAEKLPLHLVGAPGLHVVHGRQRAVGAVDAHVAIFPTRLEPADAAVHQTVGSLGRRVGLAAAAEAVVAGQVEEHERVFRDVLDVGVHDAVDAVDHLNGIRLVDREVGGVLLGQALGIQKIVTTPNQQQARGCGNDI